MLNPRKITASEVMNDDLLTFREDTPIHDAILALEDYRISGAPVVNDGGDCVGIFSASDLVKRDAEIEEGEAVSTRGYFSSDPFADEGEEPFFSKEDYDTEILGRDTVGQWMTAEVRSVRPDASIEEVCRRMVDERIHRVLVVEGSRLRGIISSYDIVKLVAGVRGHRAASQG